MPKIDRPAIYARDAGVCRLCGEPMASDAFEVDHEIPRCAYGSNDDDNLQATHRECNIKKGAGSLGNSSRFPYLTITQAAERASLSRLQLMRAIRAGQLRAPNLYHGGTRRIRIEDVDRFLTELTAEAS